MSESAPVLTIKSEQQNSSHHNFLFPSLYVIIIKKASQQGKCTRDERAFLLLECIQQQL